MCTHYIQRTTLIVSRVLSATRSHDYIQGCRYYELTGSFETVSYELPALYNTMYHVICNVYKDILHTYKLNKMIFHIYYTEKLPVLEVHA